MVEPGVGKELLLDRHLLNSVLRAIFDTHVVARAAAALLGAIAVALLLRRAPAEGTEAAAEDPAPKVPEAV